MYKELLDTFSPASVHLGCGARLNGSDGPALKRPRVAATKAERKGGSRPAAADKGSVGRG